MTIAGENGGGPVAELLQLDLGPARSRLNFSAQSAPLIGRDAELAEVTGLLADPAVRLVTLTGRGGVGKTRLALEAASLFDASQPGSVWVVSLVSVGDPEFLLAEIAAQLDLVTTPGNSVADALARWFRRWPGVVVLDNFEHLLSGAAVISDLLEACGELKVLVTSQAPLRLEVEHVVDLWPLELPDVQKPEPPAMAQQPAVALYCDRAKAANNQFHLVQGNVAAVVSLCRELEGLPLAIELAAARATTLPAGELAARIARQRLDVLRSPRPDVSPRHRNMRAAIGWTYSLLTDFERLLVRRLSVAGGAFDIDDAEAISGGGVGDVLDALSSLVDFHLINPVSAGGLARFELAPSIRDFMSEELASSGEADDVAGQWLAWLAGRARAAGVGLTAPEPDGRWRWLESSHDTLRNALQTCLDLGRADSALDLLVGLAPYWDARASHPAHARLLDRAIELADGLRVRSAAFAEALIWSGTLGIRVLSRETADRYVDRLKRGEELAAELVDDRLLMLAAHCRVLTTVMTGEFERGVQAAADGLAIATRRGEPCWISRFELHNAQWALHAGDKERTVALAISGLEHARRAADSQAILGAGFLLQLLAPSSRAAAAAVPPPDELLAMARAAHQKVFESMLLSLLALQSLATGDTSTAAGRSAAALEIFGYDPASYPAGFALLVAAEIAGRHGDGEFAARVHGRLQEIRPLLYAASASDFVSSRQAALEEVRAALGESAFDDAVATGTGLPWDTAIAQVSDYLRTLIQSSTQAASNGQPGYPSLTERQLQVIRLLGAGLTNKEIGQRLGMTPKTVMHHTVAIYQRLGVRGRSEAVAWAIRTGVTPAPALCRRHAV